MFVKDKNKNIHYEALSNVYEKPIKLIDRISKLIHICLRKSEIGLGFTLGTEETTDKDESYTFVRKILDFSPAKYDGRLQVGDRILKINNVDVGSMPQAGIVALIRSLPIGDLITISVTRHLVDNIDPPDADMSQSQTDSKICDPIESKLEIFHFIITITRDIGKMSQCYGSTGVLGISVECRTSELNHSPSSVSQDSALTSLARLKHIRWHQNRRQFFVKSILRNGSASQDSRLRIGDEILAVQGIDVQNGKTYIIDPHYDIYGDIFHFDLAAVFLRNLEKLNKILEFREMFEMNSENPLYALKALIKRAGDMYSSISIVIRREVPYVEEKTLADNDLLQKTYKSSKKKINELCRIENIFELNPDYRRNYSDCSHGPDCRQKDYMANENESSFSGSRNVCVIGQFDSGRSLVNCSLDELRNSLQEFSSNIDREKLYLYFSKAANDQCDDNGNDCDIHDQRYAADDICGELTEDIEDKNVVRVLSNKR